MALIGPYLTEELADAACAGSSSSSSSSSVSSGSSDSCTGWWCCPDTDTVEFFANCAAMDDSSCGTPTPGPSCEEATLVSYGEVITVVMSDSEQWFKFPPMNWATDSKAAVITPISWEGDPGDGVFWESETGVCHGCPDSCDSCEGLGEGDTLVISCGCDGNYPSLNFLDVGEGGLGLTFVFTVDVVDC